MYQRGIAYIELLISVLLISAFAVPLFAWTGTVSNVQSKTDQHIISRSLLESAVAAYRALPDSQRVPATTTTSVSQLPAGQLVVTVTELDSSKPSLLQYVGTLTWQSSGGTQTDSIVTYINGGKCHIVDSHLLNLS